MTQVALITDTHYGVRNASTVFFDYFKRSFDYFFDYLDENKISRVIHLGDLFDQRKSISVLALNRCRQDFLDRLEERGIETDIIVGNHDVYYKNTNGVNTLEEVIPRRYNHVRVNTVPKLVEIDGVSIQLLPWIPESADEGIMETIRSSRASILMGHLELAGFEMFRGSVSEHGMDRDVFSRYDMVLSGHFHHKSSAGNIHYLGAFTEHTWADYNDPRGFHVLDLSNRSLEFIPTKETVFGMYSFDDRKPEISSYVNDFDYSQVRDKYVKVVNASSKNNPYLFDVFMDRLYKSSPIKITVVEDVEVFTDEDPEAVVDEAEDTPTILSKYIDSLTLPVDNARMKSFMKKVYHEAMTQEI